MDFPSQDFTTNFYSISGFKVQERYKNFNLLLQNIKNENTTESFKNEVVEIRPKSHLEEIFRVEMLIRFRIIDQLFETIKGEKPHLIKKIIKHEWFFQEAFKDVSGEQLVYDIFPFTSYSTRLKLIAKICKFINDEQQIEDYFNAINKKYGITTAARLLPACTSDFIRNKMNEYKINFSSADVLRLYKKDYQLALIYFDDLHKFHYKYKVKLPYFTSVFQYIAAIDPKLFLDLVDKYDIHPKIGARLTKKVINCDKKAVSKNARKFIKILEPKLTMKTLCAEVDEYYLNLFPKSLKEFPNVFNPSASSNRREWQGSLYSLLKYLEFSKKGDLLLKSFYKTYQLNIWDHKDFITEDLIQLLQPDQRENCLKVITKDVDKFIYCYEIKKSISMIKEKLKVASNIQKRMNLLKLLVKACAINNDLVALKDVCKYYVTRHKNEQPVVHANFLQMIQQNFRSEKLDDELWSYIKVPLDNIRLSFRQNPDARRACPALLERYICYRLFKNLSVDDELRDLLNFSVYCYFISFEFLKKYVQFEKLCLLKCGEMIPNLFVGPCLERAYEQFTLLVIDFNSKNPKEEILLTCCPSLMPSVKNWLINDEYYSPRSLVLYYLICKPGYQFLKAEILDIFWKKTPKFFEDKVIFWLLHHEPEQVITNIVNVIKNVPFYYTLNNRNALYKKIFRKCKVYSHTDVCKSVIDYCQSVIKSPEEDYNKQNAITILSILMAGQEFLDFVEPLLPVDTKTDESNKLTQTHVTIAKSLENVSPAFLTTKCLLFLANGDYLKYVLSPLYPISSRISENKLHPIINELLSRPVSVRKHGMKIASNVSPVSNLQMILMKCSKIETNSSIRSFLVRQTFKFCLYNPSDEVFELLKTNMRCLDVNDTEAFEVLDEIDLMPVKYFNDFIEITWSILNLFRAKVESTCDTQVKLLSRLTKHNIISLNNDFSENLIAENLLVTKSSAFCFEVQKFACKYLFYYNKINLEQRANFVVNILKTDFEKFGDVTKICEFLKYLCEQCLIEKIAILDKFTKIWSDVVNPHDAFDCYLHFHYSLMMVEVMNDQDFAPRLGINLGKYCDTLVTTYGGGVVHAICDTLELFIAHLPSLEEGDNIADIYLLLKELLKSNLTNHSGLIVIYLLSKQSTEDGRITQTFTEIIDLLRSINDPVVQMSLKYKFRNVCK